MTKYNYALTLILCCGLLINLVGYGLQFIAAEKLVLQQKAFRVERTRYDNAREMRDQFFWLCRGYGDSWEECQKTLNWYSDIKP